MSKHPAHGWVGDIFLVCWIYISSVYGDRISRELEDDAAARQLLYHTFLSGKRPRDAISNKHACRINPSLPSTNLSHYNLFLTLSMATSSICPFAHLSINTPAIAVLGGNLNEDGGPSVRAFSMAVSSVCPSAGARAAPSCTPAAVLTCLGSNFLCSERVMLVPSG